VVLTDQQRRPCSSEQVAELSDRLRNTVESDVVRVDSACALAQRAQAGETAASEALLEHLQCGDAAVRRAAAVGAGVGGRCLLPAVLEQVEAAVATAPETARELRWAGDLIAVIGQW